MTQATRPRLRIGLLLDALVVPAWVWRIVDEIQRSEFAEVTVLITAVRRPRPRLPLWQRISRSGNGLVYRMYTRLDRFVAHGKCNAFDPRDLQPLVDAVPVEWVTPDEERFSDRFPPDTLDRLRAYDLDVALRFGFRILRGDVLRIARHGVWSFHHGDGDVNRGGPAGFWEVMEGSPITGSILQMLTEELDGGPVLYRSFAPTDGGSVIMNKNNYYWKSTSFVLRSLRLLYQRGAIVAADPGPRGYYSHRLYRQPRNLEAARLVVALGARIATRAALARLTRDRWVIAYAFTDRPVPLYRFRFIAPPSGVSWADPFPVPGGEGRWHIYCEETVAGKGTIVVIRLDRDGTWARLGVALERPYHVSYPFVFNWQGDLYLLPETASNGTIELYRCVEPPLRFEPAGVLLRRIKAADATLLEWHDRWWMFASERVKGATTSDEVSLFWSDSPLGPFTAHPCNPIKSDVRSARPAGRLFEENGTLYRPAQRGAPRYGYGVSINRVEEISETAYREEQVWEIVPKWDRSVVGVHTFNRTTGLSVVDCLLREPRARIGRGRGG
jgi:hypothetical protein